MTGDFTQDAMPYAEHGCAVIPCGRADGKTPLIRGWRKFTRPASEEQVVAFGRRFPTAGVGVATGPVSRITVVDIDAVSGSVDSLVASVERRCGKTPLMYRTPRGGVHLLYRYGGERTITKLDGAAIDVRGMGGLAVVPPTRRADGVAYSILCGKLDDLDRLPAANAGSLPTSIVPRVRNQRPLNAVTEGCRNETLFLELMRQARTCATVDELECRALILNESLCKPPMEFREVAKSVRSVWNYKEQGRIWVSGAAGRVLLEPDDVELLTQHPDAAVLYLRLRFLHGQRIGEFPISPKAMAGNGTFKGWGPRRIRGARDFLLGVRKLLLTHEGGQGVHDPHLFVFSDDDRKGADTDHNKTPPPLPRRC